MEIEKGNERDRLPGYATAFQMIRQCHVVRPDVKLPFS